MGRNGLTYAKGSPAEKNEVFARPNLYRSQRRIHNPVKYRLWSVFTPFSDVITHHLHQILVLRGDSILNGVIESNLLND